LQGKLLQLLRLTINKVEWFTEGLIFSLMQARPNHTFTANFWFLESVWNEFVSFSTTSTKIGNIYGQDGLIATHTNEKTIEFPLKDHLGSPRVVAKQSLNTGNLNPSSTCIG